MALLTASLLRRLPLALLPLLPLLWLLLPLPLPPRLRLLLLPLPLVLPVLLLFFVYISGANSKKMLSLRRSFVPRLLNCSQV